MGVVFAAQEYDGGDPGMRGVNFGRPLDDDPVVGVAQLVCRSGR